MREQTKAQCVLILAGLVFIPLGIAIHRFGTYIPYRTLSRDFSFLLGGMSLVIGIGQLVSDLWISFRYPGEFTVLPADVADRLTAVGEDPARYQDMVRSFGARHVREFVRSYAGRIETQAALYRDWSPRLRQFADQCRVANPCPSMASLPARDEAKIPIYRAMINGAERLPRRPKNEVVICRMPAMAIPIAQDLWPGADDRCVFLTPEELSEWQRIYTHPEDEFWWFIYYWWIVQDPPKPDSALADHIRGQIPPGIDPWLAISGIQWGDLAGGEVVELWSWNGKEVTSCGVVCDSIFYRSTARPDRDQLD